MTDTYFNFGAAKLVVSYCNVNDYLVVKLASGGLTYFAGYADEVADIWSQEARALMIIGHKFAHQFALRRMLYGRELSDLAYRRRQHTTVFDTEIPGCMPRAIADITYYSIDVRGDAYALYSEDL